jgi:hypothetical protein
MKTYKLYIASLFILFFITACDKVIDLKLGNVTGQLVIEGNVTNIREPQYVKLSTNVAFSGTNTYPPVTGATVIVSDAAGHSYPFTEGPSGTYSNNRLAGITGSTYIMTVTALEKNYTANSVMPAFVALDSITSKINTFNSDKNRRQVAVHYKDPAGVANQYRFVMYVNNVQVKRVFANNDDFTDGRDVSLDLWEDDIDIYPGDTVTVEMQCVDKPIYTYWFTLMQQGNNGPGGSVTPSNPPNNITPTVLGYFSAHTTQTKSIIVE